MSKVTVHYCDFNPNVKQHPAHFHIIGRGEGDGRELSIDACAGHWAQMVNSLFNQADTPAKDVAIRRISGVDLPGTNTAVINTDGDTCPICNDGFVFKSRHSFGFHMRKSHDIGLKDLKKLQS